MPGFNGKIEKLKHWWSTKTNWGQNDIQQYRNHTSSYNPSNLQKRFLLYQMSNELPMKDIRVLLKKKLNILQYITEITRDAMLNLYNWHNFGQRNLFVRQNSSFQFLSPGDCLLIELNSDFIGFIITNFIRCMLVLCLLGFINLFFKKTSVLVYYKIRIQCVN